MSGAMVEQNRTRELALTVRVTEDERAMLQELAEWSGLSQSDIVRQLVRQEHKRESAERGQKTSKPRGRGR